MGEKTVDELEQMYKGLEGRRSAVQNDVNRVTAALDERRRTLKATIAECKKEGFDPDTLPQDIQHLKQVLMTKMEVLGADLAETEAMVRPMTREIERG